MLNSEELRENSLAAISQKIYSVSSKHNPTAKYERCPNCNQDGAALPCWACGQLACERCNRHEQFEGRMERRSTWLLEATTALEVAARCVRRGATAGEALRELERATRALELLGVSLAAEARTIGGRHG